MNYKIYKHLKLAMIDLKGLTVRIARFPVAVVMG